MPARAWGFKSPLRHRASPAVSLADEWTAAATMPGLLPDLLPVAPQQRRDPGRGVRLHARRDVHVDVLGDSG